MERQSRNSQLKLLALMFCDVTTQEAQLKNIIKVIRDNHKSQSTNGNPFILQHIETQSFVPFRIILFVFFLSNADSIECC